MHSRGLRKRDQPPELAEDESDFDGAGQWNIDGRAHAGV